jgi:hypothetical protein
MGKTLSLGSVAIKKAFTPLPSSLDFFEPRLVNTGQYIFNTHCVK